MKLLRIGIDFDRTLFDTDGFKNELETRFPEFSTLYDDAVESGIYKPRKHAEIMDVKPAELFKEMKNCKKFVYRNLEELERINNAGHQLHLVTRGDAEIQRLKIKGAGVQRYFDSIEVISKSIDELAKDSVIELDLLVDDRDEELDAVKIKTLKASTENQDISVLVDKIMRYIDEFQSF